MRGKVNMVFNLANDEIGYIIPHTQSVTTWGTMKVGQRVNIEIDMLARYVARMLEWRPK